MLDIDTTFFPRYEIRFKPAPVEIRRRRTFLGLSQYKLSLMAGLSRSALRQVEEGKQGLSERQAYLVSAVLNDPDLMAKALAREVERNRIKRKWRKRESKRRDLRF